MYVCQEEITDTRGGEEKEWVQESLMKHEITLMKIRFHLKSFRHRVGQSATE